MNKLIQAANKVCAPENKFSFSQANVWRVNPQKAASGPCMDTTKALIRQSWQKALNKQWLQKTLIRQCRQKGSD